MRVHRERQAVMCILVSGHVACAEILRLDNARIYVCEIHKHYTRVLLRLGMGHEGGQGSA